MTNKIIPDVDLEAYTDYEVSLLQTDKLPNEQVIKINVKSDQNDFWTFRMPMNFTVYQLKRLILNKKN